MILTLPPLGLLYPAQRGYCDVCRLEDVARLALEQTFLNGRLPAYETHSAGNVSTKRQNADT